MQPAHVVRACHCSFNGSLPARVTGHLEWRDQAVEREISGTTTGRTGVFLPILALPLRYACSRQPSLPRLQRRNAHAYTTGTDICCRTSERPDRVPQLNQAAGLVPESSDETGSLCRPAPRCTPDW